MSTTSTLPQQGQTNIGHREPKQVRTLETKKGGEPTPYSWTGRTIFKVLPAFRLLAKEAFYNAKVIRPTSNHKQYKQNTPTQQQQQQELSPERTSTMNAR